MESGSAGLGGVEMLESVSIRNFRKLSSLDVNDMGRICLISGKNNVGKSTLLEALFLFMDHVSHGSFAMLNNFRGAITNNSVAMWEPVFYGLDASRPISIVVRDSGRLQELTYEKDTDYLPPLSNNISEELLGRFRSATKSSYSLRFTYKDGDYEEEGHFFAGQDGILRQMDTNLLGKEVRPMRRTVFLSDPVARFNSDVVDVVGRLELTGKKGQVVDILHGLDLSVDDITIVPQQGISQLYVRSGGVWMPIQFAGDGLIKLLHISLALLDNPGGLVLIDEIEAGLHYSAYGNLWSIVDKLSLQMGCQVVATTHSYELIAATRENISEPRDFSFYRLGKSKGQERAFRYDYSMLEQALGSEMEVR